MFEIKYNFSDNSNENVAIADETELRYNLFLGSLNFKRDNKTISTDWDWIPLLDVVICLVIISNSLLKKMQGKEEFEFTESDLKIIFQKDGDWIKITASFSDEILEMSFEEFQRVVKKFYKDVIFAIVEKNHEIKDNSSFIKYLKEAEKM